MLFRFLMTVLLPIAAFATGNDIPVRIQWMANSGYCGETSLISAGLYYGQYMSQYDVRALVTKSGSQMDQLLLGINDKKTAEKMHLDVEVWDSSNEQTTDQFLAWVKQNVAKGYPVVIGVYLNQWLFEGDPNPDDGDSDYDHIVPVYGVSDDVIYFSDNGLWNMQANHQFSTPFGSFQATRRQANGMSAPIYSLSSCDPSKMLFNYGIAIKGVKGDTLPVRVDTNVNGEAPSIADMSENRPAPTPLVLTVTVSNLEPGVPYVLYRYNKIDAVPESNFNAHASDASEQWQIQIASGSTYTMTEMIQSNEIAVYRAVKASAS